MERLEMLVERIDEVLDTKRKRHIAGGVLLSVSLLLAGLAITALTLKEE